MASPAFFFVIQVCFSLAHLCFAGIFGWWVCYLGLVRFFCVVSAFLRRRETKQFCCFRYVFLAVVFWPAVLLFLRFAMYKFSIFDHLSPKTESDTDQIDVV